MTNTNSNDNGRYYEYLVTNAIAKHFKFPLTLQARRDNKRDLLKEGSIQPGVKAHMNR
jgi:hypothetical protein